MIKKLFKRYEKYIAFSIITLPPGFATSTAATMGEIIGDLSPYIILVVGVILAMLVISILITTLHHKE
jgi:hypothetical protein